MIQENEIDNKETLCIRKYVRLYNQIERYLSNVEISVSCIWSAIIDIHVKSVVVVSVKDRGDGFIFDIFAPKLKRLYSSKPNTKVLSCDTSLTGLNCKI